MRLEANTSLRKGGQTKNTEKSPNVTTAKDPTYKCQNQTERTVKMTNKLTY